MSRILYSKFLPGCTAEVIGDADSAGRLPAYVRGEHPEYEVIAVGIDPNEWSETEVVPVPEDMPDVLYAVLYGKDASTWQIEVYTEERLAKFDVEVRSNAIGIIPLYVGRNQMVLV